MKSIVLALAVFGGLATFTATDADAFVCARGPYRAGCVGPNGAVGVHRGYAGGVYRGGAIYRGGGYRRVGVIRRPGVRRF